MAFRKRKRRPDGAAKRRSSQRIEAVHPNELESIHSDSNGVSRRTGELTSGDHVIAALEEQREKALARRKRSKGIALMENASTLNPSHVGKAHEDEADLESEAFGSFIGSNLSTQAAEIASLKNFIDSKIDSELHLKRRPESSMQTSEANNLPRELDRAEPNRGLGTRGESSKDQTLVASNNTDSLAGADMNSGGLVEVQLPDAYRVKNEAETALQVRKMKKRGNQRKGEVRARHARDDFFAARFRKAEFHRLR